MAIRSDNRPNEEDVSYWLEGKADQTLRAACGLVDCFRKNKKQLSDNEMQTASEYLYELIHDAAKVVCFAHENDNAWSGKWVDLMFHQGSERYTEFNKRVIGEVSIDSTPLEFPLSIHKALDLLDEIEQIIQKGGNDISLSRSRLLEKGHTLLSINREIMHTLGNELIDLVDEQAVYVSINWQEFCQRVLDLIQEGRRLVVEEGQKSIKSWAYSSSTRAG